eukprot:6205965-Pleurochrysis_carterae.AAC.7
MPSAPCAWSSAISAAMPEVKPSPNISRWPIALSLTRPQGERNMLQLELHVLLVFVHSAERDRCVLEIAAGTY